MTANHSRPSTKQFWFPQYIALFLLLFVIVTSTACGRARPRQRPAAQPTGPAAQATLPAAQATSNPEIASIPNLGETEKALCTSWGMPKAPVTPGKELRKLTLNAPGAICNDGSPAVMYIRPAQDEAKSNEWVFYLQGGGSCNNYEDCRIRWCGEDYYTAAKMSSRWVPDGIKGQGIFSSSAENSFAGANQVFLYYCSSDTWAGQKSDSVVANPDDPTQQYTLHFHGHTILEATVQILRAGAVSDDGQYRMPLLSTATDVLFTGTSGGSAGVTHNADWFAGQFDPAQTTVHAVMDANFPPDGASYSDEAVRTKYDSYSDYRWNYIYQQLYGAFVDQSCLAALSGSAKAGNCVDLNYLFTNHITTPYFVRQDLQDSAVGKGPVALGSTMAEFGQITRAGLLALPGFAGRAAETAAIQFVPGVYAPNCGQHTALTSNVWFLGATVRDASGKPFSFHDALRAWLDGQTVVIVDTLPATLSNCKAAEEGGG